MIAKAKTHRSQIASKYKIKARTSMYSPNEYSTKYAIEIKISGFWKESIPFFGKKYEKSDWTVLTYKDEIGYPMVYLYESNTEAIQAMNKIVRSYEQRGDFKVPLPMDMED